MVCTFSYEMPVAGKMALFLSKKRLNRIMQFVPLMKRQRSTFKFCSSGRVGKNKEHVRSRWTQDICSPYILLFVSEINHFKSNQFLCQKEKQSLVSDQTVTVCKVQITFSVYCAMFPVKAWSKAAYRRDLPGPQAHQIWHCFYWQRSLTRAAFNGIKERRREIIREAGDVGCGRWQTC